MITEQLFSTEHVEMLTGIGTLLLPIGVGLGRLIWVQARLMLKVDIMWEMMSNHLGMKDEMDQAALRRRNGRTREP